MTRYSRSMKDILIEMRTLYAPCPKCGDKPCECVVSESVELDEAKYDLYHKDFSSAMQHAYAQNNFHLHFLNGFETFLSF